MVILWLFEFIHFHISNRKFIGTSFSVYCLVLSLTAGSGSNVLEA